MAIVSMLISMIVKPSDLAIIDMIMDIKLLFGGFFLIGLVFMAIGFLISVLIDNVRLAMPISTGVFFITYLLGTFSGMIDKLEFLKYFSPFHYAVPSELIKNGFDIVNIYISFIIIVVSISSTYIIYRKKDFNI